MAKIKKITDVTVQVEFRGLSYAGELDKDIKKKSEQAKDFIDFLKDHRSADVYNVKIKNDIIEICEYCGMEWEWDDDPEGANCCKKAVDEFENNKKLQTI